MYDPILAKSFSRHEQKRLGYFAAIICLSMALSFCMFFKPQYHPLSFVENAVNLQISINAAQDMLIIDDDHDHDDTISTPKELPDDDDHDEIISLPKELPKATETEEVKPPETEEVKPPETEEVKPLETEEVKPPETQEVKPLETEEVKPPETQEVKPMCRTSEPLSDYCEIVGDIRIEANTSTIFVVVPRFPSSAAGNKTSSWTIQPYARKGNKAAMDQVKKWTIKLVEDHETIPQCTSNHSIPGIIFSTGGFTGNPFHDFSDVIVPLYSTSQEFKGDVQFLVTNYARWWISKYRMILSKLSKRQILPIDQENVTHCYSNMIIGLKSEKELQINSTKFPNGSSMKKFREFLRKAYSLERVTTTKLQKGNAKRPRLMIISRSRTRKFINEKQITRLANKVGYDVIVAETSISGDLAKFAGEVNSCDVLMGVHGAGLTNMVFLPKNGVLIQVIPLGGIDWYARRDFGEPAEDMNIEYLEYKIKPTESSLSERFPMDHEIFRDPLSFHKKGWLEMRSIYLDQQNVRIDLRRFRPTLIRALKLLKHRRRSPQ